MEPYYERSGITIYHGDCREVLPELAPVDAVVTDPPYGLRFMGKAWDYDVPGTDIWSVVNAAMKPGAHLLAFAGTRTQHRMAVNIEDAGFEIRDMIAWVYGSGFPKSLDVSKAIDNAAGAEREVVGERDRYRDGIQRQNLGDCANLYQSGMSANGVASITVPATDAAREWDGWGTALKPAMEPITVARKPFAGTVAENSLAHGTGALNIDACRVAGEPPSVPQPLFNSPTGRTYGMKTGEGRNGQMSQASGRWPANLIHDGSDEVLARFPMTGASKAAARGGTNPNPMDWGNARGGSAARFFYCAKSSKRERGEGNTHPTVKPLDLMRYLIRLVTHPSGVVLDPFAGSGSTLVAARSIGNRAIGIELDERHCEIAARRLDAAPAGLPLNEGAA